MAGTLALTTATAGAVLGVRGIVGGAPTAKYAPDAPEAASGRSLHYATQPVLLGTADLSAGRRFELVGYQMRSPSGTELCLDVRFEPDGMGEGCANDRERAQATTLGGPLGTEGHVTGATEPDVARVVVSYESDGRSGVTTAALARVGAQAAHQAQIAEPFGFYVAEVPGDARHLKATAFSERGQHLWTADFATEG